MRLDAFEPIKPECKTCRYSDLDDSLTVYVCRRYAPMPGDDEATPARWPRVEAEDWCGEYTEEML